MKRIRDLMRVMSEGGPMTVAQMVDRLNAGSDECDKVDAGAVREVLARLKDAGVAGPRGGGLS